MSLSARACLSAHMFYFVIFHCALCIHHCALTIVHCAFTIVHLLLCIFFCFPIGQVLPPVHYWLGRILESLQSTDGLQSTDSLLLLIYPCHPPPAHYWLGWILKSLQSTDGLPLSTCPCHPPPAHYWLGWILESLQSTDGLPLSTSLFFPCHAPQVCRFFRSFGLPLHIRAWQLRHNLIVSTAANASSIPGFVSSGIATAAGALFHASFPGVTCDTPFSFLFRSCCVALFLCI